MIAYFRRCVAALLIVNLLAPHAAHAGLVATDAALDHQRLGRIDAPRPQLALDIGALEKLAETLMAERGIGRDQSGVRGERQQQADD